MKARQRGAAERIHLIQGAIRYLFLLRLADLREFTALLKARLLSYQRERT